MTERPRQAVIVAGGRGTRLGPLTDHRPKPMIEFHGRPFLEYLVEMLREQGFHRVLMLLGYRAEMIEEHFGDGSAWDVSIDYSVSPAEDETGRRVWLARERLDPRFLFLYCDNYWPLRWDDVWRRYLVAGTSGMITVYRNHDGHSRDNVRLDEAGLVETYDRARTSPGLKGVEIGYAVLPREVVGLLDGRDAAFEELVYPRLAAERQLAAYVTDHRYYSVGSLERLPITERFLARRPAVILDRDGVLNERPPRAHYVRSWAEFRWLPGALEALRLLRSGGFRIVVVSNQAGIARGAMSAADLDDIHRRMVAEAEAAGGGIDASYHCPHDWDEGCECRKPKPGMLYEAQRDFSLDLTRTLLVGDDERDGQAAEAAGCPYVLVSDRLSLLDVARALVSAQQKVLAS